MPTSDLAQGGTKNSVLWTGKLPLTERGDLVLIKNIGLNSEGILNASSLKLAACLELPHHEGAGGVEDSISTKEYEEHIKKNKKWSSKKKKKSKLWTDCGWKPREQEFLKRHKNSGWNPREQEFLESHKNSGWKPREQEFPKRHIVVVEKPEIKSISNDKIHRTKRD